MKPNELEFTVRGSTYRLQHHPAAVKAARATGSAPGGDWYFRLPAWLAPGRPLRHAGPSGSGQDTRDATGRTADQRSVATVRAWLEAGPDALAALPSRLESLCRSLPGAEMPALLTGIEHWVAERRRTLGLVPLCPVADVVAGYITAGCPDAHRRARTGRALYQETRALERALEWWGDRNAVTISVPADPDAYHRARIAAAAELGRGSGHRSVDNELGALRNALSWGVREGRTPRNPLSDPDHPLPVYQHPDDVTHCSDKTAADDETLHRLLSHLFATPGTVVSGARLAFSAMTGLRPGETTFLRWDTRGTHTTLEQWGQWADYRVGDRSERKRKMLVYREKGGINPAIRLHPALEDLLDHWRAYCATHWPGSPWMFPAPDAPDLPACRSAAVLTAWRALGHTCPGQGMVTNADRLSVHLRQSCRVLSLPRIVPHGMRAYYVRVRRAQGVSDREIGSELGHTGGEKLITTTYGSPVQVFGTGAFDWLPATGAPAWTALAPRPTNLVILKTA